MKHKRNNRFGFTLIELLVVMGVLSILIGLLVPALGNARSQARAVVCQSQLRQLVLANIGYAHENDGFLVPAASDMWDNAGTQRWHGKRACRDASFDPNGSPLKAYLAEGRIKKCPARVRFLDSEDWTVNYEKGCGGYGYNMTYLGSRLWDRQYTGQFQQAYEQTTSLCRIRCPSDTLMFADTAMSQDGQNLIEYSFAEPPYAVFGGQVFEGVLMSPSIHFRHRACACVGWADGHVDQHRVTQHGGRNAYGAPSMALDLGWFGPLDNSLFDLD